MSQIKIHWAGLCKKGEPDRVGLYWNFGNHWVKFWTQCTHQHFSAYTMIQSWKVGFRFTWLHLHAHSQLLIVICGCWPYFSMVPSTHNGHCTVSQLVQILYIQEFFDPWGKGVSGPDIYFHPYLNDALLLTGTLKVWLLVIQWWNCKQAFQPLTNIPGVFKSLTKGIMLISHLYDNYCIYLHRIIQVLTSLKHLNCRE